jgi:hypothetical protein
MHRAMIKIFVSLALALGLTFTMSPSNADAATHVAHSAARATTPSACANQQAWVNSAKHNLARTQRVLRKTQAAHHQRHHAAKVKAAKKHVAKAKHRLARSKHNRDVCVRNHQPATPTVTTASPVQALCDAGVPQAICDALAGLAAGAPSASDLNFASLCTQVPGAQALCDAISGAAGSGLDLSALQGVLTTVLNTVGLGDLLNTLGLGDLTGLLGDLL